jgi:hypothetical protein
MQRFLLLMMVLGSTTANNIECGQNILASVQRHRKIARLTVTRIATGIDFLFQNLSQIATLTQSPGMPSPCYEWNCTHPDHPWKCRWCLPFVFIPGIPKSGTTELYMSLALHPEFISVDKEINIFTQEFKFHSLAQFETKVHAHLSSPNMINETNWWVNPYKYWIDGSASCAIDSPHCLDSITKYSPATKSLLMVRDPYQRYASLLCMIHLQNLIKMNLLDRNSEEFVQWLSEVSYQNAPQHNNFWTLFFILEMRARRHKLLVIDNYDLAHKRKETMIKIGSFLGMLPFSEKVFAVPKGLNSNSFLVNVNYFMGNATLQPPPTATTTVGEFVYRYNSTTTLHLKSIFSEFLCAYETITKTKLQVHSSGI